MEKQYYTPSELLQEPVISEIFSRPQEIGMFARLFSDKIQVIKTDRTRLIDKESFLSLVKEIKKIQTGKVVLP